MSDIKERTNETDTEELNYFLHKGRRIQADKHKGYKDVGVAAINTIIFFETNGYTTGK
jgi:hypothetical protein